MPRTKPPSILSSPVDLTMSPTAPPSVYSSNQPGTSAQSLAMLPTAPLSVYSFGQQPGPSTQSVNTYSSGSFTSLVPSSADYNFELERLQIEFKRSQDSLHMEREHAEAQRRLFERARAEQEARHRQELEDLRRQLPGDRTLGKRRK